MVKVVYEGCLSPISLKQMRMKGVFPMRKRMKVEQYQPVEEVCTSSKGSSGILAVLCVVVLALAGVSLMVSYLTNKQLEEAYEDFLF